VSAYEAAGVDYSVLDAAKRLAMRAAVDTSALAARRGAVIDDASRGEPAVVVRVGGLTLAFVLECLGTKSMIAGEYLALTGRDRYDAIGYDTVAAAVNDLVCVGALPFLVNAYFATGSADWYGDTRHDSLVSGWRRACEDSGAAWGGGESPTLAGLVAADEIDLAASAIGIVPASSNGPLLGDRLAPGNEIVLVASTGLHANGASLARRVAADLPRGLAEPLPGGRDFGEALLDPSAIYVGLVDRLVRDQVPVSYVSHITGHGLRKVMRASRQLSYRIDRLPPVPEVLTFLAAEAGLSEREAYATLNMGAGLAVFCAGGSGTVVVDAAYDAGLEALVAGVVEDGPRRILLDPIGVEFDGSELELR
jgi:phosphoribosylformylglycinamidine cyclo-ligase